MKTTAVICEYNPFHKGHELQIDGIKQRDRLSVCIMSGGFVQRGIPALYDKFVRAEAAVRCGADLVLELPYPYSCSAAEFFAGGGVKLCNSLGIIDELCFGSECGDINKLNTVSDRLMSDLFTSAIKSARSDKANKTKPYAVLREEIYRNLYGDELPVLPNDILGIEYISSLKKTNSKINPFTYKREKGFSATASRRLITEEQSFDTVPDKAAELFANAENYKMEYAERAILAFYRKADPKELKKFEGMTDGIADKLVKCAKESTSLQQLIERVSGKSYTNAKIRRCILHGMTGTTTDMLKAPPPYTQVLACGSRGRELLKDIRKKSSIPVITKPAHINKLDEKAKSAAEFNLSAEDLLTLMSKNIGSASSFLKCSPYIEQENK